MLEVPEELGVQARIQGLAAAHHHVETLADDVHHAVAEVQVQLDIRVARHELGQCRHHQPGHLRQADPQSTAWRAAGLRERLLGGLYL